jgi:hypothetical protein
MADDKNKGKKKAKKKATRESDANALDRISKEKDPAKRASLLKKLLGG